MDEGTTVDILLDRDRCRESDTLFVKPVSLTQSKQRFSPDLPSSSLANHISKTPIHGCRFTLHMVSDSFSSLFAPCALPSLLLREDMPSIIITLCI